MFWLKNLARLIYFYPSYVIFLYAVYNAYTVHRESRTKTGNVENSQRTTPCLLNNTF